MRIKAFIDTNIFIYGFEFKNSNSLLILEMINENKIEAFTNLHVIGEVKKYFEENYSKNDAYNFTKHILETCAIIFEEDFSSELKDFRGKIKEKDLPQLAATKAFGLKYLVSFDRDFDPFEEYFTPKKFVNELGLKPKVTDY